MAFGWWIRGNILLSDKVLCTDSYHGQHKMHQAWPTEWCLERTVWLNSTPSLNLNSRNQNISSSSQSVCYCDQKLRHTISPTENASHPTEYTGWHSHINSTINAGFPFEHLAAISNQTDHQARTASNRYRWLWSRSGCMDIEISKRKRRGQSVSFLSWHRRGSKLQERTVETRRDWVHCQYQYQYGLDISEILNW